MKRLILATSLIWCAASLLGWKLSAAEPEPPSSRQETTASEASNAPAQPVAQPNQPAVSASTHVAGLDPLAARAATNEMIIVAEQGFEYTSDRAVFQGNVSVFDVQLDLSCERLTIFFETNRDSIASIVAETNVVLMDDQRWAVADRAIYAATNNTIRLEGDVIVDTPQGYIMAPLVILDRRTGRLSAPRDVFMGSHPGSGLLGTNVSGLPLLRPRRPSPEPVFAPPITNAAPPGPTPSP